MIRTEVEIYDTALHDVLDKLTSQFSERNLAIIMQEAKKRIERITVLQYPPASRAKMSDLWTDKQRRWFFANLRKGNIHLPYRRTGKLARALEIDIRVRSQDVVLNIGIPDGKVPYAKYVIGKPAERSTYFTHRTRWQPLPIMIAKQLPAITQNVVVAFETIFEDIARYGTT